VGGGEERLRERCRLAAAMCIANHPQQDHVELDKGDGEGGEARGGARCVDSSRGRTVVPHPHCRMSS
jgi:hypothetical protein